MFELKYSNINFNGHLTNMLLHVDALQLFGNLAETKNKKNILLLEYN